MEQHPGKVLINVANEFSAQEDRFHKIGKEGKGPPMPRNELNAVQSGTSFIPPEDEWEDSARGSEVSVTESKEELHIMQCPWKRENTVKEEIDVNKARHDTRVPSPDTERLPPCLHSANGRKGVESELVFVYGKCLVDNNGQSETVSCSPESLTIQQQVLRTEHAHCTRKERPETLEIKLVHDSLEYPELLGATAGIKNTPPLYIMAVSKMKSKPTFDFNTSLSRSKVGKPENQDNAHNELSLRETTETNEEIQTFCNFDQESKGRKIDGKEHEAGDRDDMKPGGSKAPWEGAVKGKEIVHTVASVGSRRYRQRRPFRWRVTRARLMSFVFKYCLFALNFFFWVTSVVAIVLGAWLLEERGQLVQDSASFYLDPSAMLCLVGSVTFVVAFIGCLGALRENICLLTTFQVSMIAVLLLETVVGVVVFLFYAMPEVRRHIKMGPEEVLRMAIRLYHDDAELQRWIDLIQKELKCCGASDTNTGYTDWKENPYFNCTPHNPGVQRCAVPTSCCIKERGEYINDMCGFDTTGKEWNQVFDRIYTQGCMKGLGLWLSAHDVAIGAISLAIISPQIVCVILARQLVASIRRQRARWRRLSRRED